MGKGILLYLVLSTFIILVENETSINRTKRQSPVPFMNPPIPTSIAHYLGGNQQLDQCQRDEVLVKGGCHRLLTQGPCTIEEYVLLDPDTQKGYCAPRLCPPDRIFVFSDQQCHDPRSSTLCPPGRQLYESAYGTPVCQCPDGTYEGDDDLDDDVCDPILGRTLNCPPNQVLWFRDFTMPPECLPDPCGGENLNRGPNDLPFVPSVTDGRCYQLGQTTGVCPAQSWFSLALESLKGQCTSLEDAGYEVFDEETLSTLTSIFGPPIPRETTAPIPAQTQTGQTQTQPSVRTLMTGVLEGQGHHRGRRSPLPHATPGNVFETRLVGCRAGAIRDINAKCRNTILPARAPVKRSTAVPPVPPRRACPTGQAYNLRRQCVPRNSAVNSINAFNLG